ncbi:hypothetical protein [Legionella brunensis]|uniref:Uncharacterized protein n=1 Tax=Legionella brunensis TaxID=29422 RepID=A0A0W0SE43_9GAMM|nr:hypothetical protein [Legionella brunensis]KTC81711.1 hypothetical protein Lbru_2231 [Legionella brunensis]
MMSVLNLLARVESTSSSLVPSKATSEGTMEIKEKQASSPGSLGSPNENQEKYNFVVEDIQLTTVCKCGYRRPFCTCGFYKFPD